ncbi:KinB-signaling pathway activation protein [Oceanobacillus senegalensis]|uniref:KinB-signaling pathway activation protein n=1 Tax=Oceanobacillus senegalensis TaxID=1936063 RepID=UPI000A30B388|nr:KinB-signaling pathway activation protein [Oceanobacillus senegalensis]
MKIKYIVNLFVRTAVIGGLAGLLISFFIQSEVYMANISPFNFKELVGLILFNIGLGITFSAVSMTGFFAYLFINRFGLNLFRSFWPIVQVLLILFVLFDLVYFPYQATKGEVSIFWYILMSLGLLGYSWLVAMKKVKETKKTAFIPTLFFMIVMTTIEWVPGLQADGTDYAWLMIAPLLACNTFQILALHRYSQKSMEEERAKSKSQSQTKTKTTKA